MDLSLVHLVNALSKPAFVATEKGSIEHMNGAMRTITGIPEGRENENTLISLGLFDNHAEFRGFVRGFQKISPLQKLQLPGTRLQNRDSVIFLKAVWFKKQNLILGLLDLSQGLPLDKSKVKVSSERHILHHLPYFVLVADANGNIIYANAIARNRLPLGQDANDQPEGKLAKVDAEFTATAWKKHILVARNSGECSYETTFLLKSGRLLPVSIIISQVHGIPVRQVEMIARDISAERQKSKSLRTAHLKVQELEHDLERREKFLQQQQSEAPGIAAIVTGSLRYQKVLNLVELVAETDSPVLITGESGTGKELIGRAIHAKSSRAHKSMVTINCGALPAALIESELFGHRKGAFTGAYRDHVGRFELADQSTLFLDEIGELPLLLQTRLLRFLQEGEFTPVGGNEPIYADVRIISATNRNLDQMIQQGDFRADLFYRLNVFPIHNPPLRERLEDLPLLVDHFIQKYARSTNSRVTKAAPGFLKYLAGYTFPGNIRELENIVQRALIMSPGTVLLAPEQQLDPYRVGTAHQVKRPVSEEEWLGLEEMQKQYIQRVLQHTNGKVSGPGGAAEILRMNAQTLYTKIKKLNIER